MLRSLPLAAALIITACASTDPQAPASINEPQTVTLTGTVTREDYPSYLELPFNVPPGVKRLTLSYDHTAKGDGVVLDLGLRDPDGQRGWSGSNKTEVVLSAWEATPAFRAGPIIPGQWTVILGVPAVREGKSSDYTVTIELDDDLTIEDFPAVAPPQTRLPGSGFFARGDFHTHTGHSDGSCAAPGDPRTPCPTATTVASARAAGLDFVAITDHNTLSQLSDIRALEGIAPNMTIIPGSEITTFQGHANAIGLMEPLEFQLGGARLPELSGLFNEVESRGALLSVNHPGLPTGERCMGCGWNAETDWSRVDAIEVVNGGLLREGTEEGPFSGIVFWESLLDNGHRITAIGGSDNHDPMDKSGAQSPIGAPTTVVRTQTRGVADIIAGVRSGNVFLDMQPRQTRTLRMTVGGNGQATVMGGVLHLDAGEAITGSVVVTDAEGLIIEMVAHGVDATLTDSSVPASPTAQLNNLTVTGSGGAGWFRANVRDPETGKLLLLGNPIYVVPR